MARVLAIDFGRKRVGLAVSDPEGIAITNLSQLHFNVQEFWPQLSAVISEYQPETIVVGWPTHENPAKTIQKEISEFLVALSLYPVFPN